MSDCFKTYQNTLRIKLKGAFTTEGGEDWQFTLIKYA